MGLDGGTIISRSDVLRGASWELSQADGTRSTRGGAVSKAGTFVKPRLDRVAARVVGWTTCALSGEPLQAPVVADWLGNLYNKAAVLEFLLARAGHFETEGDVHRYSNQLRTGLSQREHLASVRDVFEVRMLETQGDAQPRGTGGSAEAAPLSCPMTSASCLHQPFSALPGCGHVFSSKAISHMAGVCGLCSEPFDPDMVVGLLGDEAQKERLLKLLPLRPGRQRGGKRKRSSRERRPETNEASE